MSHCQESSFTCHRLTVPAPHRGPSWESIFVINAATKSYFQDLLPQFPGYASTLFANAMIVGQLLGNLLGGIANDVLGVENSFYISGTFLFIAFILFFFTKKEVRKGEI